MDQSSKGSTITFKLSQPLRGRKTVHFQAPAIERSKHLCESCGKAHTASSMHRPSPFSYGKFFIDMPLYWVAMRKSDLWHGKTALSFGEVKIKEKGVLNARLWPWHATLKHSWVLQAMHTSFHLRVYTIVPQSSDRSRTSIQHQDMRVNAQLD